MANSKIQKADGTVLIDISTDTVTSSTLAQGTTAHNSAGELITGTMQGGLDVNVEFSGDIIPNNAFKSVPLNGAVVISDHISSIGESAFSLSGLTSVTIGNGVTSIGSNAFRLCSNLTTITIDKPQDSVTGAPWDAENATVVWTG